MGPTTPRANGGSCNPSAAAAAADSRPPAARLPSVLTNITGLARWWARNANPTYAHVQYNHWLGSEAHLTRSWQQDWLRAFAQRHALPGMRILDYGIGGGLLGEVLLRDYRLAHYTGVDISDRSLDAARQRLTRTGFYPSQASLLHAPVAFAELRPIPDVLISLAVIQHFPSRAYADAFFSSIEASAIPLLLLQIEHASPPACDLGVATDATSFSPGGSNLRAYAAGASAACQLDAAFLLDAMPSFNVTWMRQRPVRGSPVPQAWVELTRTRGGCDLC